VEQLKETLREKTLALDRAERELHQARRQAKEQHALPPKNAQERKDVIKQAEGLQEQLSQLQSENVFLRQQLGEVRNKAAQEHKVSDAFICEADKVEKEVRWSLSRNDWKQSSSQGCLVLRKVSRCKLPAWESITRAGSGFVGIAEGAGKPWDVLIDTYLDTVSASSQQNVLETEIIPSEMAFL